MKRTLRASITHFLTCLLLLAGMASSLAFSSTEPADNKIVLQLKWFHQFQFAGYYAAVEKGFYAEEGLEVELRERDPKVSPVDAVLSGDADVGILDASIVMHRLQGKPLVVLAVVFQRSPLALMTLNESNIVNPLQLKGKRVMFQRNTSGASIMAIFNEVGMSDEDYTHLPYSFKKEALLTGDADAMSIYTTAQPYYYESKGHKVNIISPANYGIDFYGDLLFVSEKYLLQNNQKMLAFRRASLKGWAYALAHPEEVVGWLRDKYPSSLTEAHLLYEASATQRVVLNDLIELGHFNRNRFLRIASIYQKQGILSDIGDLEGLYYLDYLDAGPDYSKWTRILAVGFVLISMLMLALWAINLRLKAKVAHRTLDLEKSNQTLAQQMAILDRYVISSSTDLRGNITQASNAFCEISGYSRDELMDKGFSCVKHPDMPLDTYLSLWETLRRDDVWQGELLNRDKNGNNYWLYNMIEPICDENNKKAGYTSIAINISDHKQVERLLTMDALTGLSNRRHLDEFMAMTISQVQRYQRSLSLILIDVDYFKQVNDQYGHQMGDRLLQHIAQLCADRVRETDLLGRWGGEEFMVICPETDLEGARVLAEELHQSIEEYQFPCDGDISCSFGVAEWKEDETACDLFKRCDKALYNAKAGGRNRVETII